MQRKIVAGKVKIQKKFQANLPKNTGEKTELSTLNFLSSTFGTEFATKFS